ncbi:light-harvesting protein of photosystem I [Chloropicon primus]|uniref:Chlorophyll a-b binding protein, chloroplastic n=1 Tax=Chloropicon primus TaxID=1764295 RepID=A0A5B8MID0_9CHLO|nr:light-harvesting protein of photosystem I [Chloropicon primus]UPQ99351.1 light-harvesting protein of photosystem I [Chloropicon primus]|eukprot:QDZ20139.1 light-harvesting protein of photosystem I [Chloropicon primus]
MRSATPAAARTRKVAGLELLRTTTARRPGTTVVVRADGGEGPKTEVEGRWDAADKWLEANAGGGAEEAAETAAVAVVEEKAVPAPYVDDGPPAEWRGWKWSEIKRMNKGRDRPLWYPGGDAPAHLTGELPGDFGFDPLNLGSDPDLLVWFQQAELQHARWAMVGAAGILVPELLGSKVLWTEAGAQSYAIPWQGLLGVQLFMMGWAESRRWEDIRQPGSQNKGSIYTSLSWADEGNDLGYPGGDFFDPLRYQFKFDKNPELMKEFREKEIKNGRLAMVSLVGFAAQTFVTGKGPIQCWLDHIADPGHQTLFQNMGH